jgi:hypothetical protein
MYDPRADDPSVVTSDDPNRLAELLQELRILLQGAPLRHRREEPKATPGPETRSSPGSS